MSYKVRLLWVEGWGCEKGKASEWRLLFKEVFQKRKKRGWSRNRGSGKYHKMQGVEDLKHLWGSLPWEWKQGRAGVDAQPWGGTWPWTVRRHQEAGRVQGTRWRVNRVGVSVLVCRRESWIAFPFPLLSQILLTGGKRIFLERLEGKLCFLFPSDLKTHQKPATLPEILKEVVVFKTMPWRIF